jgi:hypothetical protein
VAAAPRKDDRSGVTRNRVIAVVLIVAAALAIFVVRVSDSMADFEVYWRGATRAAAAEPLYRADDEHYRFKYFPSFAVLAIPIGLLPLPTAKAFWFTGSVVLLVVLIWSSVALLNNRRKSATFLTVVTVAVLGKFFGHELVLGQVNILFTLLAVCALLAIRREHETLAGVLVAVTIAIKPYGVLFVPWLVARRRGNSIVAVGATLAFIAVLPVPLYGVAGTIALYRDWWATVSGTTASTLTSRDNVSFAGAFAKWLGPGTAAAALTTAAGAVAIGAAAAAFIRRRGVTFPEALEGSVLLMLIPLLSPQGWDYVLLLATPAIVLLANHLDDLPTAMRTAALVAGLIMGLSVFDVMGRPAYAKFMDMAVITVCATILLAAMCVLRARKVA